jgi:hypothetical protein
MSSSSSHDCLLPHPPSPPLPPSQRAVVSLLPPPPVPRHPLDRLPSAPPIPHPPPPQTLNPFQPKSPPRMPPHPPPIFRRSSPPFSSSARVAGGRVLTASAVPPQDLLMRYSEGRGSFTAREKTREKPWKDIAEKDRGRGGWTTAREGRAGTVEGGRRRR